METFMFQKEMTWWPLTRNFCDNDKLVVEISQFEVGFSPSAYPNYALQIVTKLTEWILTIPAGFAHAILKLSPFPRQASFSLDYFFKIKVWHPSRTSYHAICDHSRFSVYQVGCISPNLSKSLSTMKFGEIWRDLVPQPKISLFRKIRLTKRFFRRPSRDS